MSIEEIVNDIGLGEISAGAILTLVIISIVRGWLIPRLVVNQILETKDQVIANLQQANASLHKSLERLVETGETTTHLLESLPKIEEVEAAKEQETKAEEAPSLRDLAIQVLRRGRGSNDIR